MQKFADPPLTVHEGCGGQVERLLSPPALQFKGSGWYVTDYARNGTAKSSEGSESKSESKKGDGKPDSKPAAKTETSTPASAASKPAAEK